MSNASPTTEIPPSPPVSSFDAWFELTKRGSTLGREVRGGLVTFFTMAYIIVLNPLIIGTAADANGNLINGMSASAEGAVPASIAAVAAATALVAGLLTLFMGGYARFPIAIASGLGLNAVVAYVIAPKMTWPQAMGLVFWEGLVITILVLTGFRKAVFNAVPRLLRAAISVGIGLFIAFVGLADAGVVRAGNPLVQLGVNGSLVGWPIAIFVIGLVLIVTLYVRKVRGAMLIGILAATVLGVIVEAVSHVGGVKDATGAVVNPTGWMLNVPAFGGWSLPDLSLLTVPFRNPGDFFFGAFGAAGGLGGVLGVLLLIFALLLADFFDTMGTIVAVGAEGDLLGEDGNPPHTQEILLVDSIGAMAGGLGSVSSTTSYIESAAGVGEGARTGIASLVTGAAFLLSLVLAPLVNMVPSEAAAPALVFVGFLMMSQVVHIDWSEPEEGIPAFLTLALMPFAYSITVGIGAGFLFYALIKLVKGKGREVHPLLYGVAVAFLVYFVQGAIFGALGG
ncbi:MAG: NCS2 family permease [Propionicimonas sp.]|nr:NCS2 family permease [Propionicimonas sp.]MEA4942909.1 NCS2 family permease [Propionicimonas sp.]